MTSSNVPPLTILCVDADADRRGALVETIEGTTEATVETAASAAGARKRASEGARQLDCVLTAETVPDSTDVGCVRAVRDVTDELPVVVIADDRLAVAEVALDAGATDVVERGNDTATRLAARRAVDAARSYRRADRRSDSARVATLFENTTDAIVEAELDGDCAIITKANRSFGEVFGYDPGELVGKDIDEVVLPPDRQDEGKDLNRRVASGERVEMEGQRLAADGLRDFLLRSVCVEDDSDRAYFVYTDITERKRREEMLRMLHDSIRELMVAETRTDVASRAVATGVNVLGLPKTTIYLADGDDELVPAASTEGDIERVPLDRESPIRAAFLSGEFAVCTPPGTDGPLLAVPLMEHGVLTAGTVPRDALVDTTVQVAELLGAHIVAALDRAAREDLLREREAELKEQRDRFAALFENIPDPAVSYVFGPDGTMRVTSVNSAFEEVMGYDAKSVVGNDLDQFIVPPAGATEAAEFNEELIDGNTLHVEVQRQTANGVHDFLLHGVPVTLGERSVFGFAIYSDTTEQKERERELRRQNERLDEFASIVSHDLRNPLTVARGHRDILASEYDHDSLVELEWAFDRMESLIDDVLELARQGKAVEDPEPVPFGAVVHSAWASCHTRDAKLSIEDDFPAVLADAGRLSALFENLFRNAVEHGGEDVTVTVSRTPNGFTVSDDGPGIADTDVDCVFQQGFTTIPDGTGFGLAIVEDVADAHGWTVCIDQDHASGGAHFVFSGVTWGDEERADSDLP
ncbi:PAS domain S-box protein [Haloarchaeobius sp. TZWWS8]|uniref:PAS domain S-box protein n=1 Tax=Haloarchaeobius sp. TZWWS8 TaxID=3446121 RepID=UPI003EBED76E